MKRRMYVAVNNTNRGQCPYTVKEALHVAGESYYSLRKELESGSGSDETITFSGNGYHFQLVFGYA